MLDGRRRYRQGFACTAGHDLPMSWPSQARPLAFEPTWHSCWHVHAPPGHVGTYLLGERRRTHHRRQGSRLSHQTLPENFEHTHHGPWPQEVDQTVASQRQEALGEHLHHLEHRRPDLPSARRYRLAGEVEACLRQEALGAYQEEAYQEHRPSSGAVALGPCLVIGAARQYRHRLVVPTLAATLRAPGQVFPWQLGSPRGQPAHRDEHQQSACRPAGCSSGFLGCLDDGPSLLEDRHRPRHHLHRPWSP